MSQFVIPDISVNPHVASVTFTSELGNAGRDPPISTLFARRVVKLDNETTFNVGKIEGGSVRNAVPANVYVQGEFRTSSIETLDNLSETLNIAVNEIKNEFPESKIDLKTELLFENYKLKDNDPCLKIVTNAIEKLGLKPNLKPSGGGTDGNVFITKDIKSVVVGMGVTGMHTINETVSIPDLVDSSNLCQELILSNC